jgi:RNA polymerase sigma-70 factor (ECF subfamily)
VSEAANIPVPDDVRARIVAFIPRLRRFCGGLSESRHQGDDLMQATVERALSRIDQWQPGTSLESWMYRMARNIRIDRARADRVRGAGADVSTDVLPSDDVLARLEARSDLDAVRAAMASLPAEQRELMALVVIDGQSYKDAAEILEIPIGTVMSRIARARRSIAQHVNRRPWEANA